jgi:ribonucleotide monophosphatase NagD (HAD superfamily)
MGFATKCGYKKLLVLSGVTGKEALEKWTFPEEYKPDYYVDSWKTVHDLICRIFENKL